MAMSVTCGLVRRVRARRLVRRDDHDATHDQPDRRDHARRDPAAGRARVLQRPRPALQRANGAPTREAGREATIADDEAPATWHTPSNLHRRRPHDRDTRSQLLTGMDLLADSACRPSPPCSSCSPGTSSCCSCWKARSSPTPSRPNAQPTQSPTSRLADPRRGPDRVLVRTHRRSRPPHDRDRSPRKLTPHPETRDARHV
jgi:hypothetical protein